MHYVMLQATLYCKINQLSYDKCYRNGCIIHTYKYPDEIASIITVEKHSN